MLGVAGVRWGPEGAGVEPRHAACDPGMLGALHTGFPLRCVVLHP